LIVVVGVVVMIAVFSIVHGVSKVSSTDVSLAMPPPSGRQSLAPLVESDPAFSQPAFEDFAFQLYARTRRAEGAELARLTPYFADTVMATLANRQRAHAVVIGSLRVHGISLGATDQRITVRIEANLASGGPTLHVVESWTFMRANGVRSRAPEEIRAFHCPSCNAPFQSGSTPRACAHCGKEMRTGSFDWTVIEMTVVAAATVGRTLTGTVPEVGTDLVTIVDPNAYAEMQALYEADKHVTLPAFDAHVRMIFDRLNAAWNTQDLGPVRGLVTSALLGYLQFWIDEYKRQQLANRNDDAKVSRIAIAKVVRDKYFDAITVRVFADGLDYTTDASGQVVGGSNKARREYSEYWTLLRAAGRTGTVTTTPVCPNCGAPLSISDAGACTHCSAEIEGGQFDWVLSKIEQDEVYAG